MGILVVLLVAAWGLVLGPALVQSLGSSPIDTERMFRKSLRAMGRRPRYGILGARNILVPPKAPYPTQSAHVVFGPQGSRAARTAAARRRRNLTFLAVFIIATFVLGLPRPLRFLLVLNMVADVLLVLYLALALYLAVWPPPSEREQAITIDREPVPKRVAELG